jgi:multiple sugar transport system substrate-binding protein
MEAFMNDRLLGRRVSNRARVLAPPAAVALAALGARGSVRAQASGSIRLTGWASSPAEQELFEQVLDDFRAAFPDIELDYAPITGDYLTKLQTDMAAETVADVFYVDSMPAPDLMAAGQLLALDDYMAASGVSADDFIPSLIEPFQWQGKTYGLPKDFSTLAMVYDNQALTDAGVAGPPATWDELRTVGQTLTDATGAPAICIPADVARYFAFHYAAGARVISEDGSQIVIDSPEAQTALDFYYGLYRDGIATTPADAGAEWPGDALAKGLASIVFEGNWVFPFLQENAPELQFGISELPAGPAGKATLAFTVAFSAFADTPNPDAAWELINYLTGPEGMTKWTSLGLAMPSRVELVQPWSEQFPERGPFIAGGEYARGWQIGRGGIAFYNDANAELQGLFAGQQDVATTLQKMQQAAEARIQLGGDMASPVAGG